MVTLLASILVLLALVVGMGRAQAPGVAGEAPPGLNEGQTLGVSPAASSSTRPPTAELSTAQGADAREAYRSSEDVPPGISLEGLTAEDFDLPPRVPDATLQYYSSYRIIGSALRPRESNVTYTVLSDGGCIYATSGDDWTVWNAPLSLPDGSQVDYLRIYYDDTNADADLSGWFTIYDLYGKMVDEWWVTSEGSTGTGYWDTDLIEHTIDYSSYSYVVNFRPVDVGSSLALCGFRIFYYPPPFNAAFLPHVTNNHQ
jgi:hypothetical protein